MKTLLSVLTITLSIVPAVAAGDVVTEWNEITLATAAAARISGTGASRITATVHAAVFDAANSVEGRYASYKIKVAAAPGASAEAAAVAAAYTVLTRLIPDQKPGLDAAYARSLGRIAGGAALDACAHGYSGCSGVSTRGSQSGIRVTAALPCASPLRIAVIGRQRLNAYLASKTAMYASAAAISASANRRAFSSRLRPGAAASCRTTGSQLAGPTTTQKRAMSVCSAVRS